MPTHIIKTAPDLTPDRCLPSKPTEDCATCARRVYAEPFSRKGYRAQVLLDGSVLPARPEGCPLYVP